MEGFVKAPFVSSYIVHKSEGSAHYLLIRRCGKLLTGIWQGVSGGVHKGESAPEAAVREIFEETGIVPDRFFSADAVETFYMPERDMVALVPMFVAFVDEKREVRLSDNEHDAYAWLDLEAALERLTFSEQRRIIRQIHENFVLKEPQGLFDLTPKAGK